MHKESGHIPFEFALLDIGNIYMTMGEKEKIYFPSNK